MLISIIYRSLYCCMLTGIHRSMERVTSDFRRSCLASSSSVFIVAINTFLVLSYVYSKQPILGLTQEWFRELSFSRLECGVHKLHISSADWWDLLLPLA